MILSGQVSSPAGGGIETVEVEITTASITSTDPDKISYTDSNLSQVVTENLYGMNKTITIPKNSLVAMYNTNLSGYGPRISYRQNLPNGVDIVVGYSHTSPNSTFATVYAFSQDCSIAIAHPCLIAGTLITLSNGTTKKVEDITYDDELLVWDFFNGCFASAKPRWIKVKQTSPVYNKLTFSNGATLGLVGEGGTQGHHRIYNKQAGLFTHTGVPETPIGTITFAEDETEPVLIKQELINEDVDYYNIITDKHFNLFANGILTSCKCSNMYRIEDMKYVGERLMSDEEIEKYFEHCEPLKLAR